MATCKNCGAKVGFGQHYKVTQILLANKIMPKNVYCTVECANEYRGKQKDDKQD